MVWIKVCACLCTQKLGRMIQKYTAYQHNDQNRPKSTAPDAPLVLLWISRFHGFPEAAGAAVGALAGPPCSQRCAAVSNSGWCTTNRDRSFAVLRSICFVWKQNDGLKPWALSTCGGRWDSWFFDNFEVAIYMFRTNHDQNVFWVFSSPLKKLPSSSPMVVELLGPQVTVCDYDPTQTPLARLSKLNRHLGRQGIERAIACSHLLRAE